MVLNHHIMLEQKVTNGIRGGPDRQIPGGQPQGIEKRRAGKEKREAEYGLGQECAAKTLKCFP